LGYVEPHKQFHNID